MAALNYLQSAGIVVEAVAGKLRASPVELITPELHKYLIEHKSELLAELRAANDTAQAPAPWLQLLVLANGRVIQQCGDLAAADVKQRSGQRYGGELLAVVAVPGYQRPLTEAEIVKALAGTLPPPTITPQPSSAWLVRVARLLGVQSGELLDGGHLEQCDLIELAGTDPAQVAGAIRSSPAWISRAL